MDSDLDIRFVTGAMTDSTQTPIWQHFPKPMRNAYPYSKCSIAELPNCSPFEVSRWQNLVRDLVSECNHNGKKTILIGHSEGGSIACCVAALADAGSVCGVVTIFTPHLLFSFQPWLLPMPYTINVPIVSFHGTLDTQVWYGTEHAHSIAHEELVSDHMGLGDNPEHAERIAAAAQKYFSP